MVISKLNCKSDFDDFGFKKCMMDQQQWMILGDYMHIVFFHRVRNHKTMVEFYYPLVNSHNYGKISILNG